MTLQQVTLWVYVVLVAMLFGGALFERLVIVSAWSSDLPRTVRDWNVPPRPVLNPGRFFAFVTLPLMLVGPVELYFAWSTAGPMQARLIASSATLLAVIVATVAYYLPTLERLTMKQGRGLDNHQLVATAKTWLALQWLRLALVAFAWLSAFSTFTSPLS